MKKTDLRGAIIVIAIIALALGVGGCSFVTDGPGNDGRNSTATLVVDKTITSVVAGQADTITIKALDASSARDSVAVASAKRYVTLSEPNYSDSAKAYSLTVIGSSGCLGDDTLTISTGSGLSTTVTVKVTDPLALHLDGLLVRFVNSFDFVWNSAAFILAGPGAGSFFRVYEPRVPEGYYSLGSYFVTDYAASDSPVTNDTWRTIVAKDIDDSGALARPLAFSPVVTIRAIEGRPALSVWSMVPPTGYYAMGVVAVTGTAAPDPATTGYRCVHKDYVAQASYTTDNMIGWGTMYCTADFWLFPITTPSEIDKDDDQLALNPGLRVFRFSSSSEDRILAQCAVIKGTAPVMLAQEDETYLPSLSSKTETEGEAWPVYGRRVVALPWFGFNDSLVTTLDKFEYTPIYRLERDYYYVLGKFRNNQLSTPYTLQLSSRTGVSSSTTKTQWSQRGVDVGPSFGLKVTSLALFKLSKQMGFATTESASEFNETTVTDTLVVPVGKAGGLFQKCDDLKILRRDSETGLWENQVGDTLTVVEGNIVPDEYPD